MDGLVVRRWTLGSHCFSKRFVAIDSYISAAISTPAGGPVAPRYSGGRTLVSGGLAFAVALRN
jgi:hypothetical protein